MILLKILLWLLLILLALILLVLVAPIGYQASGRYAEDTKEGKGQVSLFWGLLRLKVFTNNFRHIETTVTVAGISKKITMTTAKKEIAPKDGTSNQTTAGAAGTTSASSESPRPQNDTSGKTTGSRQSGDKPPRKKPALSFSEALDHLREALTRELFAVIRRFLHKIWKALRPQIFRIKVVYGLPDPYQTAVINNFLMALFAVWPHQTLQLQPVFHDSLVDVSGNIKGSLVPIAFLAAALQLILAKPVRRIWWPLLRKHRNKSGSRTSEASTASSGASSS
ncbi:hypothetical protein [Anoxynatronum sibiricum]|uniref:DUF2953 domain-containing protein n=1 Tax=Anoxynatronum sibiricum TaxID=210623 RepID=A0ABU9VX24_9CLOT